MPFQNYANRLFYLSLNLKKYLHYDLALYVVTKYFNALINCCSYNTVNRNSEFNLSQLMHPTDYTLYSTKIIMSPNWYYSY